MAQGPGCPCTTLLGCLSADFFVLSSFLPSRSCFQHSFVALLLLHSFFFFKGSHTPRKFPVATMGLEISASAGRVSALVVFCKSVRIY